MYAKSYVAWNAEEWKTKEKLPPKNYLWPPMPTSIGYNTSFSNIYKS